MVLLRRLYCDCYEDNLNLLKKNNKYPFKTYKAFLKCMCKLTGINLDLKNQEVIYDFMII